MSNVNASAGSGQINELTVFSNYGGKDLNVANSTIELNYYESILDPTVRSSLTFVDTGYREDEEEGTATNEKDDVNLTSGEKVHMRIVDGFGTELVFTDDKQLRINGDPSASSEAVNKIVYSVNTYSKESIDVKVADNWVYGRYDGKITDSVESILRNCLKTPKNIIIDPGLNPYNFLGHAEKPFYLCTLLAKKCVPELPGALGKLAGYLFYETYDGLNFRSIDMLFMQQPKRKYVYDQTVGKTPEEYDGKILTYSFKASTSLDSTITSGAMSSMREQKFNRMANDYNEGSLPSTVSYLGFNNGGLERPEIASDLDLQGKVTRNVNSRMSDDGILPAGRKLSQQIPKSQQPNFNMEEIVRQSAMRYNQLYSNKMSITIAGDFSLRAGDLIYCDFPEVSSKSSKVVSQKAGGIYMIADLCHRITKDNCYTKLNLVRDSIYRKPFK